VYEYKYEYVYLYMYIKEGAQPATLAHLSRETRKDDPTMINQGMYLNIRPSPYIPHNTSGGEASGRYLLIPSHASGKQPISRFDDPPRFHNGYLWDSCDRELGLGHSGHEEPMS
jgi:hypothetical protein